MNNRLEHYETLNIQKRTDVFEICDSVALNEVDMNRIAFIAPLFLAICVAAPADAAFKGKLILRPKGCEGVRKCRIGAPFKYVDPNGVEWLTTPPDTTDGASIPPWAQPFVGKPFDKAFIKAAVIHDHYCERQVRPWRQTHRVFFDALLESGVTEAKAKLMYYAVYLGGPKWLELMPPKPCPGSAGKPCIYLDTVRGVTSKSIRVSRSSDYDDPEFKADLKETEQAIIASGAKMTLEELEKRAQAKRPNDFFYVNGDKAEIVTTAPVQ